MCVTSRAERENALAAAALDPIGAAAQRIARIVDEELDLLAAATIAAVHAALD